MQNKIQNKFLKPTLFAAIFLICFSFAKSASAATYYMCNSASTCGAGWSTGSDVYTKTQAQSKATPWSTLSRAYAQMSGGDTLVIGNGIYTGSNNATFTYGGARTPPIGSADHWTTIMAENTGGVLFDGQNTEQHMFYYSPGSSDRPSSQYVIFQGLVWGRSADVAALGGVVGLVNARYVKFIDCGAYDPLPGNNSGFNAYGCDHILYEGCYAYGLGRYKFISYANSAYIIYRNCVVRHDADNQGGLGWPMGAFSIYDSNHILVQNSIVIDSDQPSAYLLDGTGPGHYGGCFDVYTTSGPSNDVTFTNSVCINSKIGGSFVANNNPATNIVFTNDLFWDLETQTPMSPGNVGRQPIFESRASSGSYARLTFGDVDDPHIGTGEDMVFGWASAGTNNLYSSLFTDIVLSPSNSSLLTGWSFRDYNAFHANTASVSTQSHDTTINPSLKWPVLSCANNLPASWLGISGSTSMCGIGQGGVNIGANLVYQQGKSGTLWGETGYNLQQDGTNGQTIVLMWPFPNEDIIKTQMAMYNNNGVNGARGFCAGTSKDGSPQTLTKYIWEYLGNEIPEEIYGGSGDSTAPVVPAGLIIR